MISERLVIQLNNNKYTPGLFFMMVIVVQLLDYCRNYKTK